MTDIEEEIIEALYNLGNEPDKESIASILQLLDNIPWDLSDAHILLRQKPTLILKLKFLQSTQHNNWSRRTFTAISIPTT
jgi:hypothetical protein